MKKLLLLAAAIIINFVGCTTINQTLYLQNIEVSGPMNNPPLNITTDQKARCIHFFYEVFRK